MVSIKLYSKRSTVSFFLWKSSTGTSHRLLTITYHWLWLTILCVVLKTAPKILLRSLLTPSLFCFEDHAEGLITIITQRRLILSSFDCNSSHREQRSVNRTGKISSTILKILYRLTATSQACAEVDLIGQHWLDWDREFFSGILKSIETQRFIRLPCLVFRQISRLYCN